MSKNQLVATLKDNVIEIKITATSVEMANKLLDLIEKIVEFSQVDELMQDRKEYE